ncbi:hypothetical protein UCREL1_2070 [Eutypa lata UCREL1]|uniref:Uncharacterized protein n=1 Tax=Eutypa lata (strain UCR-EL1) TaxID=1287681 RepID=M7TLS5_EUTLA|nr:hypothetical protein UCREL1_2070 [Eutypa lata UCREL1]
MVEFVWESVNIGFSFISLVLTVSSVMKFVSEVLTPSSMLFNNILNTIFSLASLALDILVYVQHADKKYSLIGLAIDSVLLFFTIISVIYALITYRRLATYDDYHLPGNVKPYGYDATTEMTGYPSMLEPAEPYDPTNPKQNFSTRPRSLSALSASSLRLSFSSRRESGPYVAPQQQQPSPPETERRSSYDHRRSTQFDQYVARRQSGGEMNLRHSIEYALGTEFGWQEDPRKQRDSTISNGTVTSLQAKQSDNSLGGRQASCDASISILSDDSPSRELSVNSGATLAHSLVSVPEVHEEDEMHPGVARVRAQDLGTARQSLLGKRGGQPGSRVHSRSPPRIGSIEDVDGLENIELGHRKRRSGL